MNCAVNTNPFRFVDFPDNRETSKIHKIASLSSSNQLYNNDSNNRMINSKDLKII